ncbi:MAG: S-adenosylmethionine decarboxylase proenzyme [Rhodospirillales bacterium]|nr:S-adenosylmethionine decarboxylase proenzyme [Rhodospirillales bacterium]
MMNSQINAAAEQRQARLPREERFFAGTHLIIDLSEASRLDELDHVEQAMREAVEAAGATLLQINLHHFTPNGGITGVAILAESHISIHSWPERAYAAIDIFMCGDAQPQLAIPVLKAAFRPGRVEVSTLHRGIGITAAAAAE